MKNSKNFLLFVSILLTCLSIKTSEDHKTQRASRIQELRSSKSGITTEETHKTVYASVMKELLEAKTKETKEKLSQDRDDKVEEKLSHDRNNEDNDPNESIKAIEKKIEPKVKDIIQIQDSILRNLAIYRNNFNHKQSHILNCDNEEFKTLNDEKQKDYLLAFADKDNHKLTTVQNCLLIEKVPASLLPKKISEKMLEFIKEDNNIENNDDNEDAPDNCIADWLRNACIKTELVDQYNANIISKAMKSLKKNPNNKNLYPSLFQSEDLKDTTSYENSITDQETNPQEKLIEYPKETLNETLTSHIDKKETATQNLALNLGQIQTESSSQDTISNDTIDINQLVELSEENKKYLELCKNDKIYKDKETFVNRSLEEEQAPRWLTPQSVKDENTLKFINEHEQIIPLPIVNRFNIAQKLNATDLRVITRLQNAIEKEKEEAKAKNKNTSKVLTTNQTTSTTKTQIQKNNKKKQTKQAEQTKTIEQQNKNNKENNKTEKAEVKNDIYQDEPLDIYQQNYLYKRYNNPENKNILLKNLKFNDPQYNNDLNLLLANNRVTKQLYPKPVAQDVLKFMLDNHKYSENLAIISGIATATKNITDSDLECVLQIQEEILRKQEENLKKSSEINNNTIIGQTESAIQNNRKNSHPTDAHKSPTNGGLEKVPSKSDMRVLDDSDDEKNKLDDSEQLEKIIGKHDKVALIQSRARGYLVRKQKIKAKENTTNINKTSHQNIEENNQNNQEKNNLKTNEIESPERHILNDSQIDYLKERYTDPSEQNEIIQNNTVLEEFRPKKQYDLFNDIFGLSSNGDKKAAAILNGYQKNLLITDHDFAYIQQRKKDILQKQEEDLKKASAINNITAVPPQTENNSFQNDFSDKSSSAGELKNAQSNSDIIALDYAIKLDTKNTDEIKSKNSIQVLPDQDKKYYNNLSKVNKRRFNQYNQSITDGNNHESIITINKKIEEEDNRSTKIEIEDSKFSDSIDQNNTNINNTKPQNTDNDKIEATTTIQSRIYKYIKRKQAKTEENTRNINNTSSQAFEENNPKNIESVTNNNAIIDTENYNTSTQQVDPDHNKLVTDEKLSKEKNPIKKTLTRNKKKLTQYNTSNLNYTTQVEPTNHGNIEEKSTKQINLNNNDDVNLNRTETEMHDSSVVADEKIDFNTRVHNLKVFYDKFMSDYRSDQINYAIGDLEENPLVSNYPRKEELFKEVASYLVEKNKEKEKKEKEEEYNRLEKILANLYANDIKDATTSGDIASYRKYYQKLLAGESERDQRLTNYTTKWFQDAYSKKVQEERKGLTAAQQVLYDLAIHQDEIFDTKDNKKNNDDDDKKRALLEDNNKKNTLTSSLAFVLSAMLYIFGRR